MACETIQTAIFEQFEVLTEDIVFLKPGKLNKTSSGKVQRSLARARYLSDDLDYSYSLIKGQSADGIPQRPDQATIVVSKLEAAQDHSLLVQDVENGYHFNSSISNSEGVEAVLEVLSKQGYAEEVGETLRGWGHDVNMGGHESLYGGAQLILRMADGYVGGSDHRKEGYVGGF